MFRYICYVLFFGLLVLLSGCDNSFFFFIFGLLGLSGNSGNSGIFGMFDLQDVVVCLLDVVVSGEVVQVFVRQVVIYFVDIVGIISSMLVDYVMKNFYLWNNEICDVLSVLVVDWNDVSIMLIGSDKYGFYWVILLIKESGCINVIVCDGINKFIDSDLCVFFSDFIDWMVLVIVGNSVFYDFCVDVFCVVFGVVLVDVYWVDKIILLWLGGENKFIVCFYYSYSSKVVVDSNGEFSDKYVKLIFIIVNQQVSMCFLYFVSYLVFKLLDDVNVDELLQGEMVVIVVESDGILSLVIQVQIVGVLDDIYVVVVEVLSYGVQLIDSGVIFCVWVFMVQQVELVIYSVDKKVIVSYLMICDSVFGVWFWQGGSDLKGVFYCYVMMVYYLQLCKVEQYEVIDFYVYSLLINLEYSQVVDFNDSVLKLEGWDGLMMLYVQKIKVDLVKMMIYELYICDFFVWD